MTDPTTLRTALEALIADGIEAFRLTREYVGDDVLPDEPGWSWFDWAQRARAALLAAATEADALRSRVAELEEALDRILRINSGPEALLGSSPACASARVESANIARAALATPDPAADKARRCWCGHLKNRHTPDTCCTCDGLDGPYTGSCNGFREQCGWCGRTADHEPVPGVCGGPDEPAPAPTPAPPTPPATEPVAALVSELVGDLRLSELGRDGRLDIVARKLDAIVAAARAEVDVEALAEALDRLPYRDCEMWVNNDIPTAGFAHDLADAYLAARARRAGESRA